MNFRDLLNDIKETSSGDIATVDVKLDLTKRANRQNGKKCKKHKRINCLECQSEMEKNGH